MRINNIPVIPPPEKEQIDRGLSNWLEESHLWDKGPLNTHYFCKWCGRIQLDHLPAIPMIGQLCPKNPMIIALIEDIKSKF